LFCKTKPVLPVAKPVTMPPMVKLVEVPVPVPAPPGTPLQEARYRAMATRNADAKILVTSFMVVISFLLLRRCPDIVHRTGFL
jgi:hypothetical protein